MMGVLIDTSLWVEHFRRRNDFLVDLLESDMAMSHPMVTLELACGTPPDPRAETLGNIRLLRQTQQASLREVTDFIERENLYGIGCGLIDMVLLASTLLTPGAELWTLDKRLAALAKRFNVLHRPSLH